jgi:hypothetical protein
VENIGVHRQASKKKQKGSKIGEILIVYAYINERLKRIRRRLDARRKTTLSRSHAAVRHITRVQYYNDIIAERMFGK